METRPEPTPEGKLIDDAAALADISIREAARRAGISYGRWRQIVKGFQNVSPGVYAPVRNAPAKTIAKMAAAVDVSPAQLTEAGRDDAAAILAGLLPEPAAIAAAPAIDAPAVTADDAEVNAQVLSILFRRAERTKEPEVRAEIRQAKAAYRHVPVGQIPESGTEPGDSGLPASAIPTFSTWEKIIWDLAASFTEEERARMIIRARATPGTGTAQRAGLKEPDGLTA